ncbi:MULTISPECIES: hypothetical protein [Micromonospora]|uniref:Uncharacterized protein n=1 Tax=Micromonospora sicca TaxID=2202420 RepID=A0A317CWA6_9ACTN|nr:MULTISPECIES: hypothetical protein [unclassified Micromonospora]MBM0228493.1 hypothetical protein [Micromonospora sp. ATA51]PWR06677.1 hypothetical protein DKT69_36490 [Micromonospora sp. 4G51]
MLAAAIGGLWWLRRRRSWRETLLVSWIAAPVVFFQLWPVKGFQYLLPAAAPVVVLAARALTALPVPERMGRLLRRTVRSPDARPSTAHRRADQGNGRRRTR